MTNPDERCPVPADEVVGRYFLEHRAKLLDIAAFLDRVERAGAPDDDFRIEAMHRAIDQLGVKGHDRARRIQEIFSDPSLEPVDAAPTKGALGAHDPESADD